MANLQFGRSMLASLANPDFGNIEGLGQQIGSAQAMAREAERQKEFDANSFKLLRQGLFSADQGDVSALANRTNDLVNLMNSTTDEADRATLQDMITRLDAQRSETQITATSNTANSIIKTEQALEKLQSEMDPTTGALPPQQQKVFDALKQRLDFMKQNAKASVEADDIKLATKIKEFEDQNKLFDVQKAAVNRELSSVAYGSEQYNELVKNARSKGFGSTVDEYEKIQMDAEKTRLELDALKKSKEPLTEEQMNELKALNVNISDPAIAKTVYINLKTSEGEARINAALQQLTIPSDSRAKSLALGVLSEYAERGNIASLWFDDLREKINELPEDKLDELLGLVKGIPQGQIRQEVIDFLRKEFKREFEELEAEENKVEIGMAEQKDAIDASIALTNAENKKMPGDSGYEDPNDPDVRRAAYEEIVKAAAQQRALNQAQGVGGRVL